MINFFEYMYRSYLFLYLNGKKKTGDAKILSMFVLVENVAIMYLCLFI